MKFKLTLNGYQVELVQEREEFINAIHYLSDYPAFAIDLEFDRNQNSYGFNLCLLQIAAGKKCFLIDPFKVKNLKPLWKLIEDPSIVKIAHSAKQDILLLSKLGCYIKNLYDTQLAATFCNNEETTLKKVILDMFGVDIDKSMQQSNWIKRPLTIEQLSYAANDVIYLHELKDHFEEQIIALDRVEWHKEECLRYEAIEYAPIRNSHLRIKGAAALSDKEKVLLKYFYYERERAAEQFNVPPHFIFSNKFLLELSSNPAPYLSDWTQVKGITYKVKNHKFAKLLKAAHEGALKESANPLPRNRSDSFDYAAYSTKVKQKIEREKEIKDHFQPIKERLEVKYGGIMPLVISNNLLKQLSEGKNIEDIFPTYGINLIREVAKELNINVDPYIGPEEDAGTPADKG